MTLDSQKSTIFKATPSLSRGPPSVRSHPAMATSAAPTAKRTAVSHVIFDMDGLLLDTEKFYTEVQQAIAEKHGKVFTWELKARMMGKKALEAAQVLIDDWGLQGVLSPEAFLAEREEALDAMFPHSALLPGAERLLRHLHASRVPFCLATSSHHRHYLLKTAQHGDLFELFNHRITGDLVRNGKPAPDIFLKAAADFDPPADPASCLVFEDAPSGVAAAKAAGMSCVMVPDPKLARDLCGGADELLSSLEEFDPAAWGLPPYPLPGDGVTG